MRRFYASSRQITSGKIRLSPEETHHLLSVDRFKKGDEVSVVDGNGNEYESVVFDANNRAAVLEVKKKIKRKEKPYIVRIGVCLPKKSKFETVIDKCTQLDADEIVPLISERTIVKINSKGPAKAKRWQRKIIEAAKQSNRAKFPVLKQVCRFDQFIKTCSKDSFILMPTLYSAKKLKNALKNIRFYKDIIILIGPEGGFSPAEVKLAEERKAVTASLGKTILTTETAVIFALSVINYEMQA